MKKKYLFLIPAAAAIFSAPYFLFSDKNTESAFGSLVTIQMNDTGYSPTDIAIKTGDTVAFTNSSAKERWPASDIHPTHGIYPEFDPRKPIAPGKSWSFTFRRKGAWRFHDHLAPQIRGVITVE